MDRQTAFIQMSAQDFAALGMQDIAYLKPITRDGRQLVAIHAADGTELAVAESYDVAVAIVRQHDLEPLSAH
jgi:hypothetical protein